MSSHCSFPISKYEPSTGQLARRQCIGGRFAATCVLGLILLGAGLSTGCDSIGLDEPQEPALFGLTEEALAAVVLTLNPCMGAEYALNPGSGLYGEWQGGWLIPVDSDGASGCLYCVHPPEASHGSYCQVLMDVHRAGNYSLSLHPGFSGGGGCGVTYFRSHRATFGTREDTASFYTDIPFNMEDELLELTRSDKLVGTVDLQEDVYLLHIIPTFWSRGQPTNPPGTICTVGSAGDPGPARFQIRPMDP